MTRPINRIPIGCVFVQKHPNATHYGHVAMFCCREILYGERVGFLRTPRCHFSIQQ